MPGANRVILIGRGSDCDVVLPDDTVSRRHAELRLESQGWTLFDLDSSNGTFVKRDGAEARCQQGLVTARDILRFGSVTTTLPQIFEKAGLFKAGPASPQPPAPSPAMPAAPSVYEQSPDSSPTAQRGMGGRPRTVRCICGAPKKEGLPCPVCGA
jgi:hypothetical protein